MTICQYMATPTGPPSPCAYPPSQLYRGGSQDRGVGSIFILKTKKSPEMIPEKIYFQKRSSRLKTKKSPEMIPEKIYFEKRS